MLYNDFWDKILSCGSWCYFEGKEFGWLKQGSYHPRGEGRPEE